VGVDQLKLQVQVFATLEQRAEAITARQLQSVN
jgi:hypothetical protein